MRDPRRIRRERAIERSCAVTSSPRSSLSSGLLFANRRYVIAHTPSCGLICGAYAAKYSSCSGEKRSQSSLINVPLGFPLFDRRLISLHGAAFGFLMTPPEGMHESADVVAMIAGADAFFDYLCDAASRPDLGAMAELGRSSRQIFKQLLILLPAQSRAASRWRLRFQTGFAELAKPLSLFPGYSDC